ncbi:MAG: hypothetical protein PVJ05_06355 [Candidatus Thorarchaeota archaeon]|jgi:hypothetical protein
MEEAQVYTSPYKQLFDETEDLSFGKLLLGFCVSTLILLGSTWGLLTLLNIAGVFPLDPASFGRYTMYMLGVSVGSVVFAIILCGILIKWPRSVSLPLLIHRRMKHRAGDYFMSPEPDDENLGDAFRRSLYGSVLIVGIALTILGFELMAEVSTGDIIYLGTVLMVFSVGILPFTVMLLYFGPWLMKEAGLFHLDAKDRSLSNVGDDVEDILEFFAGVDIILVWLELTLSVGIEAPWVPIFIISVALGPLFAIILNFTLVFVFVKKRATISMMRYLSERYDVPDMATSPTYIRSQVMALVERELFMTAPAPPIESMGDDEVEVELDEQPEPEPEPVSEAPPEPKQEHIPPPPDDEPSSKKDHIPPPPGDFTESVPKDDD